MKNLVFIFLIAVCAYSQMIATAIPALKAIGDALVEETNIEIIQITDNTIPINEFVEAIKEDTTLDSLAPSVDAVLSLRSILPEDYLYVAMRQRNIRVIEIDAAAPLNPSLTAVGTIRNDGVINPYIWLSPSSVIRSAEIIGKDLMCLYPTNAEQISKNLQNFRSDIRDLKNEYELKFLTIEQFEVATMDHSFDYLLNDMNLFVTYTFPSEMNCSVEDIETLRLGAETSDFSAIVHRWVPFGNIAQIADESNIEWITPNTGIPANSHFENGIVDFLRVNLELLYTGLE